MCIWMWAELEPTWTKRAMLKYFLCIYIYMRIGMGLSREYTIIRRISMSPKSTIRRKVIFTNLETGKQEKQEELKCIRRSIFRELSLRGIVFLKNILYARSNICSFNKTLNVFFELVIICAWNQIYRFLFVT